MGGVGSASGKRDDLAGRVRAEQIAQVLSYTPGMLVANACNAAVVVATFWDTPSRLVACGWAACVLAFVFAHLVKRVRRSSQSRPATVSKKPVRRAIRNACFLGGAWGSLPLLLFHGSTPLEQLVVACICSGMLGGATIALASIPAAALCFVTPIIAGCALAVIRMGDTEYLLVLALVVVYGAVLIRAVFSHAQELRNRVFRDIASQRETRTDALTGLPNRVGFQNDCEEAFRRLEEQTAGFALICLDLDGLKPINDALGHAAGDELLSQAAQRLRACTRPQDTIARLGGDEFAVIGMDVTDRQAVTELAQRIVDAFETPFRIEGQEVISTVSAGVALAPFHGDSPRDLLKSADTALYRAKRSRGSFEIFEAKDGASERERRALERDLKIALRNGEFELHFQPLFSIATQTVVGCEALLRWHHPTRGAISPATFIPLAERTGLIRDIGEWVIKEACRAAMSWPREVRLSVNLSPVQLRHRSILAIVAQALAESGLPPHRLEVEITETVLISDDEIAVELLRNLGSLGVHIALDDFGAGYSSLNYLRRLPLDRIKIDKSFVADLPHDPHSASIVRLVIALAKELSMTTTAEGVENADQLAWLAANGCAEAQGYLLSKPLPEAKLAELFAREPGSRASSRTANG